jgi:putative oxidoreductase
MSYGILFLRLVLGLTIAAHGAQKLPGLFGGGGLRGTAGFMSQLGFRRAPLVAALAALGELSGLLFAAGFVTPLAAFAIVVVMTTAIATVHWKNGFFSGGGGFEYNLLILSVAAAVAATGPGRFSVDRLIGWDDNISGLWWGVGVLVVGMLVAALNIATFRRAPAPAA